MTITIRLLSRLVVALRARLERRRRKVSGFLRETILGELKCESMAPVSAYDLGMDLFGKHASGRNDLSSRRKTILDETLRAKYR